MNNYIEWRRHENIRAVSIPNKEQYYTDLLNIEHSWSGRMDTDIGNTFIMEAAQQIVNALELFEQGYFDCAYYSLRSAVDVATTMVFLVDMPEDDRQSYLVAWKDTADFPMQRQIIKKLTNDGSVFIDMKAKMPEFFSNAKQLSQKLNKYVHKQGWQHFYVSRNHPMNQKKDQTRFVATFERYVQRCIGVVAVMRLAFDPFPILLMDEDFLFRCFDSMTDPYSEEFVERYIGSDTIEKYKQTEVYTTVYNSFIYEEKKNDAVFNVMKYQYIDTQQLDIIYSQLHLLDKDDIVCVLLAAACEKVVKVYCYGGMLMFFTDRKTNRKAHSWSSFDFKKFEESEKQVNQVYNEVFISVFHFVGKTYFVEHNQKLDSGDLAKTVGFVVGALAKMEINFEE